MGGAYTSNKQFCIIALLGKFYIVSNVFSLAAVFSNTVITLVENKNS